MATAEENDRVKKAVLRAFQGWTFDILLPDQRNGVSVTMRADVTGACAENFAARVLSALELVEAV